VSADPIAILKALTGLPRLTALYPPGHSIVQQALRALRELVQPALSEQAILRVDVLGGTVHLDAVPFRIESQQHEAAISDFLALGIDSVHFHQGLESTELLALAEFLSAPRAEGRTPFDQALSSRGVRHVTLGRLVALDTRWHDREWPDFPTGTLDPDYAESLRLAEEALHGLSQGQPPATAALRELLQLLIVKVANSNAALGQILAVKQYENHTYCHSVNVAIISLLLGRRVGLPAETLATLVEGALLHDVGKTRIPLDILRKPAALDKRERQVMERHPSLGASLLMEVDGLSPLTPMMALEHHRHWRGGGYPDLGDVTPHPLSQIVSVADSYEAMTGARSYRDPVLPEQACLLLARLANDRLNPWLVRAFVNAITFFPLGTIVRTSLDELGVVVRTTEDDPLHPVIALVDGLGPERKTGAELDTTERNADGGYRRHIVASLKPNELFKEPELRAS
jgi:HD-GYP domain-containing protein (c-di-GMP phosphodiesterase class II)